ncbi:HIT family protein [Sphingobium sp. HBC34]|uniref:HIT family protein n=1 Tax=Sphingobium cyanobacteriorum TaxID=3063954 RepID=A0ABT8ZNG2_9SPHN|nr:HIT family protein [Sphingobium sp. HBC34]MDO7836011.1 HIT family protein [Sphingobium sp. HBC34]
MSLDGTYDDANIFALILQGKIPATKIYEDESTFSFLDIMPQTRGHALVISKWSKARNLLEMEDEALAQVMATVKKVATAIRKAIHPDGIQIAQLNGAPAGQTIFHLHVHILPRWEGDAKGFAGHGHGVQADRAQLEALANEIRAQL